MRFMTMVKAAENSGRPPQALMDAIANLAEEGLKAGVLVETGGLLPSAMGARVRLSGGKLTVTDGPYAEAKEVIGGYAVYDVESKEEAVKLGTQFMELHQKHWPGWEGECEIRQLYDAAAFKPEVARR
nr:PhnB protein [uncultured bacterium]